MPVDAILLGVVRGVRCKQDAAFCLSLNFVSRLPLMCFFISPIQ